MLSIEQLLKATSPEIIKGIAKYHLDVAHTKLDSNEQGAHILVVAVVSGGSQPQKCSIRIFDKSISVKSSCFVYCSCKMFINTTEVALTAQGSAKIVNASQKVPTKTNPKLVPGLCPHLVVLVRASLLAEQKKQEQIKQQKVANISPKLKKNR